MRSIVRLELDAGVLKYLERRATEIAAGADIERTWKYACRTKTMGRARSLLRRMAGGCERCMYCEDSRGTEIDHYRSKKRFKEFAFIWENMLYLCGGCNRQKGENFPLDENGDPLLIDPTVDEPWTMLYFDPVTGNITPRWIATADMPHPRGVATTDPAILPLNVEAVTEGRRRTWRRLSRSVQAFLRTAGDAAQYQTVEAELLEAIADNPDYGIAEWIFRYDGADIEPFAALHIGYPVLWDKIQALVAE